MILVDTSVLVDATKLEPGYGWSRTALSEALDSGSVFLSPGIYAELSIGYDLPEQVDRELTRVEIKRLPLPYEAGFLAGKACERYRRLGE